jgi:hypothetical protein
VIEDMPEGGNWPRCKIPTVLKIAPMVTARSKPKQGSVLFELDDFQLLDSPQVGVDLVLRRPIEITALTGQVESGEKGTLGRFLLGRRCGGRCGRCRRLRRGGGELFGDVDGEFGLGGFAAVGAEDAAGEPAAHLRRGVDGDGGGESGGEGYREFGAIGAGFYVGVAVELGGD